jgi:hypothetical protein
MSTYESLSHSKWDCKYHVVFVLKPLTGSNGGRVDWEVTHPGAG